MMAQSLNLPLANPYLTNLHLLIPTNTDATAQSISIGQIDTCKGGSSGVGVDDSGIGKIGIGQVGPIQRGIG